MELSPRLALAANFCAGCQQIADVGCDHGYLSLALIEKGAWRGYASDLRPGPLKNAQVNIHKAGLEGRIIVALGSGLERISPEDCDGVAICGMGGELISCILQQAPWTVEGRHRLVLQPMTRGERLRQWLEEQGYHIEREGLAREGKRLYTVLQARGGSAGQGCGRENYWLFSQKLMEDPLFSCYLEELRRRFYKAAQGKARAGLPACWEEKVLQRLEECTHGAG